MLRDLSLILSIMAMINCNAYQESNFRTVPASDARREAFDRAHALFEIDEHEAALKALEKIISASTVDDLTLDAVVLATDLYIVEGNFAKASAVIDEFEKKSQKQKLDLKRLEQAKFRLKRAMKEQIIVREPTNRILEQKEVASVKEVASPVVEEAKAEKEVKSDKEVARSVGVLLPLSGPFALYGNRTLTAMKLAFGSSVEEKEDGIIKLKNADGVTAIVIDSAGDVKKLALSVDRLVDEFKVGVVIGDILNDTAQVIAKRCAEKGVFNVALSRKGDLTSANSTVFHLAATTRKQIEALISQTGSQKRYAILFPENHYGREMRDVFVATAKEKNASVVKQLGYKPDETTFTSYIRQLVGPKQSAGNSAFIGCSEKANRIKDESARKKALRDCLDAVVPTVAFDALFIPEFPQALSYIIPTLVSEGVLVSQNADIIRSFQRTSRKDEVSPVQLLGASSWNNEAIGQRLGTQIDGAMFVDSADLKDSGENVKQFVERFKAVTQTEPATMEAYAYDAMAIVSRILGSSKSDLMALSQIGNSLQTVDTQGVVGKISFDKNRELVVPFRLFTFRDGKILPSSSS